MAWARSPTHRLDYRLSTIETGSSLESVRAVVPIVTANVAIGVGKMVRQAVRSGIVSKARR
jgi:hypothetical protein